MGFRSFIAHKSWQVILGIILAVGIIAAAGVYGYQTSQAQAAPPVQAPPTVDVSRGDVVLSVTAPGQSVNTRTITIGAKVSTSVDELLVHPGDAVKAGQVLARLGGRDSISTAVLNAQIQVFQAQKNLDAIDDNLSLSQAALALAQAQKAYATAKDNAASKQFQRGSQNDIDIAQANLILATAALREAESIYDRNKYRRETDVEYAAALSQLAAARAKQAQTQANLNWLKNLPSPNDVAQVQAQVLVAKASLDDAQQKYKQIASGANPDRILAEQQLQSAQAALNEANANLKNLDVTAPCDGVITSVQVNLGQNVGVGTALMTLIDPNAIAVEATVVEEDLPLVQVGQSVQLYFDALSGSEVTGKVARIIPQRVTGSSQANYTIVISLDQRIEHLVAGMSVDGSIVVSQKSSVLRLPRSVVHAQPDGTALIEVWANSQIENRTIHVGLKGDSFTEVVDGLSEGEQVVAR
jgi:RND family efflux transporter MFP subunit